MDCLTSSSPLSSQPNCLPGLELLHVVPLVHHHRVLDRHPNDLPHGGQGDGLDMILLIVNNLILIIGGSLSSP